jgi:hypothetical protein
VKMKYILVTLCVILAAAYCNGFLFNKKPRFDAKFMCGLFLGKTKEMVGRFGHILDCHKFIVCLKNQDSDGNDIVSAFEYSCPEGTRFSPEWDTCMRSTVGKSCAYAPCAFSIVNRLGYFPHRSNCAAFWQCDNGQSHLKCCPAGLGWNAKAQRCDWVDSCTETCTQETWEPKSVKKEDLEENQCTQEGGNYIYETMDDKTMYKMIPKESGEGWESKCPASVPNFSLSDCTCVADTSAPVGSNPGDCMNIDFEDGFKNNLKSWVSIFNAKTEAGTAYFNGNSFIDIPYYGNMDFNKQLFLELSVKSVADNPSHVKVFTNGDEKTSASIEIEVHNRDITVTLRATKTCKATLQVDDINVWNIVQVKYEGDDNGSGLTLLSGGKEANIACEGDIKPTDDPITIGKGLKGYIDNVKICKKVNFPMPMMP